MSGNPAQYLAATPLIDHQHQLVQATLKQVTAGVSQDDKRAVAVAIYRHVRDNILFGFSPAFGEWATQNSQDWTVPNPWQQL
jgi:hypothetical protein